MINKYRKCVFFPLQGQEGSAIIYALIMLVLLTLLGVSSITTTSTEQNIAYNHMYYNTSFYAAEAAREYVPPNTQLYNALNITVGSGLSFPNADGVDNDADGSVDETDETMVLNSRQSFNGNVDYNGSSNPPRGSGYEVGYKAHRYTLTVKGYGSHDTEREIEAGFYRIGF